MQENDSLRNSRYHRVVFFRGGKPDAIVFPGYVLAFNFLKNLHSSKKGRIEPAPEHEGLILRSSEPDCPAGTIVLCPRGPRLRTWLPRKPKTMRRFPDFSQNVMNLPRQSAGFALTYPEEKPVVLEVIARHSSIEEATRWATYRYGAESDGEWWPKDEPKTTE